MGGYFSKQNWVEEWDLKCKVVRKEKKKKVYLDVNITQEKHPLKASVM